MAPIAGCGKGQTTDEELLGHDTPPEVFRDGAHTLVKRLGCQTVCDQCSVWRAGNLSLRDPQRILVVVPDALCHQKLAPSARGRHVRSSAAILKARRIIP